MQKLTRYQENRIKKVKKFDPEAKVHISDNFVCIEWSEDRDQWDARSHYQARLGPRGAFEIFSIQLPPVFSTESGRTERASKKLYGSNMFYKVGIKGSIKNLI